MFIDYKAYEIPSSSDTEHDPAEIQRLIRQASDEYLPHKVIRPEQSAVKPVLFLLFGLISVLITVLVAASVIGFDGLVCFLLCIAAAVLYTIVFLRPITLTAILLYQKYAPESLRASCLFEPCCSEYMRLSILKYGTWRGIIRGVKRILRVDHGDEILLRIDHKR